jgi:hypothetical protein
VCLVMNEQDPICTIVYINFVNDIFKMGTTHTTGVDYTLEALNLMSNCLLSGEFMLLPYITSVLLCCAHFYLVVRFVTHICFAAFNWLLYWQKAYVKLCVYHQYPWQMSCMELCVYHQYPWQMSCMEQPISLPICERVSAVRSF